MVKINLCRGSKIDTVQQNLRTSAENSFVGLVAVIVDRVDTLRTTKED